MLNSTLPVLTLQTMENYFQVAFVPTAPRVSFRTASSFTQTGHETVSVLRSMRPRFDYLKDRRVGETQRSMAPMKMTNPGGGREGGNGNAGNVPINAPSFVLLLTSSVLAIASIGCVFELSGGQPTYGPTVTYAILAFSLPGFLYTFYAAVRKGQQEALDDP